MARFYGPIGYVSSTEVTGADITSEILSEHFYKGDIIRNTRKLENGFAVNDDIAISNQISIVADAYAIEHIFAMRYVKWMGSAWKIVNVDVQPPRLILTLGGVYNGPTA